jgi:hypothetical protein
MSVQRVNVTNAIETVCPIVINSTEAIFSYQMASTVALNQNVNGRPECYPNDYAYLQIIPSQYAKKCCENNALKMNNGMGNNMGVNMGINMYR